MVKRLLISWTKSVSENSALLWSLFATLVGLVLCSWEIIPQLNEYLGLVKLPDDEFRYTIIALLAISTVGRTANIGPGEW